MPKGKLSKNKRKRNLNYQIDSKVKVLSGNKITIERVNDMQKTGCTIILKEISSDKEDYIAHEVNLRENSITAIGFLREGGYYLKNFYFKKPNISEVSSEKIIPKETFWHYRDIEKKIKIVENSKNLEKSLEMLN